MSPFEHSVTVEGALYCRVLMGCCTSPSYLSESVDKVVLQKVNSCARHPVRALFRRVWVYFNLNEIILAYGVCGWFELRGCNEPLLRADENRRNLGRGSRYDQGKLLAVLFPSPSEPHR